MNSHETHRIRDIESFAAGVDHLCRDEWPREEIRDGRPVLMVSSFPLNKTRPIFLCVRMLAKMLQLGILIFDKMDSIEGLLCRIVFPKEERKSDAKV